MYKGEKVLLRAHCRSDVEKAHKSFNDYELQKFKWSGAIFPWSQQQTEEFLFNHYEKHKQRQYGFAIETIEDGNYIGWCGYKNRNDVNGTAEVAIAIVDKEYWGKGYGTDAMRTLIKFLFVELNLRKVILYVSQINERGIKSYKKIGFVEEGRLRKQDYRGGKYYDSIIMGLFREEFKY